MSQILLIVYFWLDTGAMTCGLDFEFGSESDTADSEATRDNKTWSLITSDEKMSDRVFKFLEKYCDSVFSLVSEEGRWSLDFLHSHLKNFDCLLHEFPKGGWTQSLPAMWRKTLLQSTLQLKRRKRGVKVR